MNRYWVYILSSASRTLYIGMTNHLIRRMAEHKSGQGSVFAARYRIHRLVYCEETRDVRAAIAREKQIKAWRREKKVALVDAANPKWADLSEQFGITTGKGFTGSRWTADSSPRERDPE